MSSKRILITGCSTGIGLDAALTLDRLGHHVYAGVRTTRDAEDLQKKASLRLTPLIFDVTKPVEIERAFNLVIEKLNGVGLDGLVNNAGVVISGPLEFVSLENLRKQFEINVIGQIAVTQAALSLLRKAHGRIVNVGSVSGLNAVPFIGPYSASKFAFRAMNDCLRLELHPWNIKVCLIQPGPIATPIWEKSVKVSKEMRSEFPAEAGALYAPALKAMMALVDETAKRAVNVSLVSNAVVHALTSKKPKAYYNIGNQAKIESMVAHFMPVFLRDQLVTKAMGLPK